jgi:hypothetical protein
MPTPTSRNAPLFGHSGPALVTVTTFEAIHVVVPMPAFTRTKYAYSIVSAPPHGQFPPSPDTVKVRLSAWFPGRLTIDEVRIGVAM